MSIVSVNPLVLIEIVLVEIISYKDLFPSFFSSSYISFLVLASVFLFPDNPFLRLPIAFPKPLPILGNLDEPKRTRIIIKTIISSIIIISLYTSKFYYYRFNSIRETGFALIFITFTPKWRWGPVDLPEEPTNPIILPFDTISPTLTLKFDR